LIPKPLWRLRTYVIRLEGRRGIMLEILAVFVIVVDICLIAFLANFGKKIDRKIKKLERLQGALGRREA